MYNHTHPIFQYAYPFQPAESQDMTRDLSHESSVSAIGSMPSADWSASPATVPEEEVGQQSQDINATMGVDQDQYAYEIDYTMYGMSSQVGTDWNGNMAINDGVATYPVISAPEDEWYSDQVASEWEYPAAGADTDWSYMVPESHTAEEHPWEEEPVDEPPIQVDQPVTPSQGASSYKQQHRCPFKGCNSVFDRYTNLTRHIQKSKKHVRAGGSGGKSEEIYKCGYPICERTGRDAIQRKDHCREHLRNYHKQDLFKRGEQLASDWLDECRVDKAYWYCNKCLARNSTVDTSSAWRCHRCGTECEPERIAIRLQI